MNPTLARLLPASLTALLLSSVAIAEPRQACLVGPGGDVVWANVDGHQENWPSHTMVQFDGNLSQDRVVPVTRLDTGARGSVRSRFLKRAELCNNVSQNSNNNNNDKPTPNRIPPDTTPAIKPDFGALGNPFHCGTDVSNASTCNRNALGNLAREGHKTLGYNGARLQIFQFVDAQIVNGKKLVQSVYSNDVLVIKTDGIPADGFNAEHTWPQSSLKKYPGFESSRSDIYHLLPCEIDINGRRGNLPFGECSGEPEGNNGGRVSEMCNGHFEVPEQQKGMTARAMFYVSVAYNMPIDGNQEKVLREWNKNYPPTATELERSERVQKVQGNINPFVAHPEWVELVTDF